MAWHGHKLEARSEASAASDVDLHDFKLEVSEALRKRKRRISLKTLKLKLRFLANFVVSVMSNVWFPSVSRVFRTSSVEQMQRLQIDSWAQASTPRDQTWYRAPTRPKERLQFSQVSPFCSTQRLPVRVEFGTF